MINTNCTIENVKNYWEKNPLLSYELKEVYGSPSFFNMIDHIKKTDSDIFAMDYWNFNHFKNKKVLDVGCGPGWLTVNYSKSGALVSSIDLTSKAVDLTKTHLKLHNLKADVSIGNAENITFSDNTFDLVISSGVLHHTPDTEKAIKETYRVLIPGGKAKITLYHKGLMHSFLFFKMMLLIIKIFKIHHPLSDFSNVKNADDFIRNYDGCHNPIGIGKTKKEWEKLLKQCGYKILNSELHFFPKRFIPFKKIIPVFIHKIFDNYFGTMIYFNLTK